MLIKTMPAPQTLAAIRRLSGSNFFANAYAKVATWAAENCGKEEDKKIFEMYTKIFMTIEDTHIAVGHGNDIVDVRYDVFNQLFRKMKNVFDGEVVRKFRSQC